MYVCFLHLLIVMYLEESYFFSFLIAYQKEKLVVTTVVSNKKVFWKWNQTSVLQNMWFVS